MRHRQSFFQIRLNQKILMRIELAEQWKRRCSAAPSTCKWMLSSVEPSHNRWGIPPLYEIPTLVLGSDVRLSALRELSLCTLSEFYFPSRRGWRSKYRSSKQARNKELRVN